MGGRAGGGAGRGEGGSGGWGLRANANPLPGARELSRFPGPCPRPVPQPPPCPSLCPVQAATLEWSGTNEVAALGARIPVRGDFIARGRGREVGRVGAEGSGESRREGTPSRGEAGAAEASAEGGEERQVRGQARRAGRGSRGGGGAGGAWATQGREGAVRRGLAGGGRAPRARSRRAQWLRQRRRRPRPRSQGAQLAPRPPRRLGFGRLGTAPARAPFGGPGERRRRPAAL